MSSTILIRFGEIALKGKNRRYFENALLQNLKNAVQDMPAQIKRMHGRFTATCSENDTAAVVDRLSKVFGVTSLSQVSPAALELEAIKAKAVEVVRSLPEHMNTFKVETRRPNKNFPFTSPEVNRHVGAHLLQHCPGLKVDVHRPSFILFIEIGMQAAYLYHNSVQGPGGLPVGVTGKGMLLLSGGIDSPVAGWMAMKRGLSLEALHFHSFPFTSKRSQEKAIELCRRLSCYSGPVPLHMVNVAGIQKEIRARCPEELGIILLRRMMIRITEAVCRQRGIRAIVTGESLGQVASQTLESMEVISAVTRLLILRPLLALDKHEIVEKAEAIDTYPVSIRPFEDCCTLFVPRHPVTRPNLARVEQAEQNLEIDRLLQEARESMETQIIKY